MTINPAGVTINPAGVTINPALCIVKEPEKSEAKKGKITINMCLGHTSLQRSVLIGMSVASQAALPGKLGVKKVSDKENAATQQ